MLTAGLVLAAVLLGGGCLLFAVITLSPRREPTPTGEAAVEFCVRGTFAALAAAHAVAVVAAVAAAAALNS